MSRIQHHFQKNRKSGLTWRRPNWARALAAFFWVGLLAIATGGCQAAAASLPLMPVMAGVQQNGAAFQVHEYAIIEQSGDNPTHAGFQQRVQAIVSARQSGWHFPNLQDATQVPNAALAPFGYRLQANPTPPFSGYALYHNENLIERDITRFWPVSIKESSSSSTSDFLLAFETMNGRRLVASLNGIRPWPATGGSVADSASPPVYFGDQIAYAQTDGSAVSIYAGSGLLYSGAKPEGASASSNLRTWGNKHWALELNGHIIQDGKDLNVTQGYDTAFQWHLLDNQPFFFYTKDGITHLSYAGHNLLYPYDKVVYGNTGSTAIFNPGDNGHIIWFYALRDGVWYYVEAGQFS